MADGVVLNAGAGGVTAATDDCGVAGHAQVIKLAVSADGDATLIPADGTGLDVDVKASALPTGAATSAKQDTIIGHLDGVEGLLTTIDGDTGALAAQVFDFDTGAGTDNTVALGIAVAANGGAVAITGDTANGLDVDVTRISGTVTVDGSGVTQPVSHAALTELAAAIDTEVQCDIVGALPAGNNNIGDVDVASVTGNVTVVQATAANLNVTEASAAAIKTAVEALDNAADTTNNVHATVNKPLAVSTYAPTRFADLGANATANVKATAGNVLSIYCNNENAADRYVQLHNTGTTPGGGAAPLYTFRVPAGGDVLIGTDFFTQAGAHFSTGIAFAFSTTKDTYTAGTAGDQSTLVHYI